MAELTLFNGKVPSTYTPSKGTLITARRVVLRFLVKVSGAPTTVTWYMEFAGNPKQQWYREAAEEDQGDGAVLMPTVVRTLAAPGGGSLPVGTIAVDMQFSRDEQLVRVQLACAGNATVLLTTPYGVKTF
jgi:hypothetical protein